MRGKASQHEVSQRRHPCLRDFLVVAVVAAAGADAADELAVCHDGVAAAEDDEAFAVDDAVQHMLH
jgi:hypothetical protein